MSISRWGFTNGDINQTSIGKRIYINADTNIAYSRRCFKCDGISAICCDVNSDLVFISTKQTRVLKNIEVK